MHDTITIHNARLHNLKHVTLALPKNQLIVLTGLSGSGKSTLAFDVLYKEALRQFLDAAGLVTWGPIKPPVDTISGLAPAVAVDQYLTNHSPRSTVGTATEIFTYLRVLYARLGHRPCPHCGQNVPPSNFTAGSAGGAAAAPAFPNVAADSAPATVTAPVPSDEEWQDESDESAESTFPCPHCGGPVPELSMAHFSFNKPAGACPTCTGLGEVRQVIVSRLVDESKPLADKPVAGWVDFHIEYTTRILQNAAAHYGFAFDPALPIRDYAPAARDLFLHGVEREEFRRHFPGVKPPATVAAGRFEGVVTGLQRRYAEHAADVAYREKLDDLFSVAPCPDCGGTRLRPQSRAVTIAGLPITTTAQWSITQLDGWLRGLPQQLAADELPLAQSILTALAQRVAHVLEVGVGYLSLDRASPSLSGGEAHRLRLASLLGSTLTGLLYVLDEPTIGLHQRDTQRLIGVLRRLRDAGNTVLVVEHDLEMIRAADYLVDIGPGAGKHGGRIMAAGTPDAVAAGDSLTGAYLSGRVRVPVPERRREPDGKALVIEGATEHNLKDITVTIPLGLLVAVTGVSGSGKSSLIFGILDRAARRQLQGAADEPGAHRALHGLEHLDKVITIDQSHAGRMGRSNAATYADIFTPIREAFAGTAEAKRAKVTPRLFSFNVPGGRCERCEGAGTLQVQMYFLPDVEVRCPACHGRRFKRETLAFHYRGYDIAQVLEMTVEEALALFADVPAAAARLQVLADVGVGYLQLGQRANTLSGGEAQRVKLAKELGRRSNGRTLYLLDEPTTGLHAADSARLLAVLQRLVDAGNSVVVVEHNLDFIRAADWVIDLGPEGGDAGGQLLAAGPPEVVAAAADVSYTGKWLKT
jgi:excinuclease ABC subunit A